jgi:hypothetical protein
MLHKDLIPEFPGRSKREQQNNNPEPEKNKTRDALCAIIGRGVISPALCWGYQDDQRVIHTVLKSLRSIFKQEHSAKKRLMKIRMNSPDKQ